MIGIICAMAIEVDGIKQNMNNTELLTIAGMTFMQGSIDSVDVVCVECGIGKVNAAICTQLMIDIFKPSVIINSGVAGSLSEELKIGDIVISTDAVQHDMNMTAFGDERGKIYLSGDDTVLSIPADKEVSNKMFTACSSLANTKVVMGRIATGDIFIDSTEKKLKLNKMFNAVACEMEGGAIAQTCYRNNVPFTILRCISDDITQATGMDYMQFKKLAADKSVKAIKQYIEWLV